MHSPHVDDESKNRDSSMVQPSKQAIILLPIRLAATPAMILAMSAVSRGYNQR